MDIPLFISETVARVNRRRGIWPQQWLSEAYGMFGSVAAASSISFHEFGILLLISINRAGPG